MKTTFKAPEIKELLNKLTAEEISFSRFVEILNEKFNPKIEKIKSRNIENVMKDVWLNDMELGDVLSDVIVKQNELIDILNGK